MRGRRTWFVLALVVLVTSSSRAQWLNYPTPGLPRTLDGKPDLTAPGPRTTDGKPDLSGTWSVYSGLAYAGNLVADLATDDIMPWAEALSRQRMLDLGTGDSSTVECLPRGPRYLTGGVVRQFTRIVQTPTLITMLYEELAYRQIYMDGRPLPKDPNPSFMGYSVGRWDGDVLLVETIGYNDRTWLDFAGHPHTEALRTTERYRRVNVGRMDLEITFEDPGAYRRPWTVPVSVVLAPDTDLLEYVCHENETRRTSISGITQEQRRISLSQERLAEFEGTYVLPAGRRRAEYSQLRVRRAGSDLRLDFDGRGNLLLVPLSDNVFSARIIELEFRRDAAGKITEAVVAGNQAVLTKQP